MKNCIEIWQKATIRDALPDEYKEKLRQELGKEGNKARYGSGSEQATEFAPFDEKSNISRDSNLAKSDSVGPIWDVSEDFDKMNRGQDVITESEKEEKLQKRMTEQETELEIVKREPTPSEYPMVGTFTTLDLIIRSHLGTKLSDSRKRQEDIMIISRDAIRIMDSDFKYRRDNFNSISENSYGMKAT
jgi:hypothetical protein